MHDAYHTTRADSYGPVRHSFEYLRMVGEEDVAGRDILARQPSDAQFINQPTRARFEGADQPLAFADKRKKGATQPKMLGGLQFRSQGG